MGKRGIDEPLSPHRASHPCPHRSWGTVTPLGATGGLSSPGGAATSRRRPPRNAGPGRRRGVLGVSSVPTTHTFVDVQLQLLLRDALLDPLAEGRVAGGAHAAVPVVDEAAALAIKGGGGRPIPAVLLGAETIHRPPARPSPRPGSRQPGKHSLPPSPRTLRGGGTPAPSQGAPHSCRGPLKGDPP